MISIIDDSRLAQEGLQPKIACKLIQLFAAEAAPTANHVLFDQSVEQAAYP